MLRIPRPFAKLAPMMLSLLLGALMHAGDVGQSGKALRVGGGDLLEINVFDVPELSGKFRVSNAGSVSLPLIGELTVSENDTREIEHTIAQKLAEGGYVRTPQVSVLVAEFATQGVSVLGEVKKPGVYPALGSHRLLDYLSMAEGLTPLAGSAVDISHRGSSATLRITLRSKGETRENPEIFPGDTVLVERAGVVYVVGDVMRPGGYPMDQEDRLTVLQAVALAQGVNRTAALKSAKLLRTTPQGRIEVPLNLRAMLGSKSTDISLQDEDIVFVPTSAAKSALKRGLEAGVQAAVGVAIYGRY
jgi:polysaccharide biosynthesis/export protein